MTKQKKHIRRSIKGKPFRAGRGKPKLNYYQGWCMKCRKMVSMENTNVITKKGRKFLVGNHQGHPDHKIYKIMSKTFVKEKNYSSHPVTGKLTSKDASKLLFKATQYPKKTSKQIKKQIEKYDKEIGHKIIKQWQK